MRIAPLLVCFSLLACHASPTEPGAAVLATGTWSSNGTCLIVNGSVCTLHAGCGHGQFNRPALSDGVFEVDGTYRIEIGPVPIDPPPPAHFSGSVSGSVLTLKVVPSQGPLTTYQLHFGDPIMCGPACL